MPETRRQESARLIRERDEIVALLPPGCGLHGWNTPESFSTYTIGGGTTFEWHPVQVAVLRRVRQLEAALRDLLDTSEHDPRGCTAHAAYEAVRAANEGRAREALGVHESWQPGESGYEGDGHGH